MKLIFGENQSGTSSTINYNENASLARNLICNLNLDFDTTFQISEGKFWETPEETGKYGNYTKVNNSDLKITAISLITPEGEFKTYNANSGYTLSEIVQMYPDSDISYHVVTTSGNILGWNKSTSNNIESYIIQGYMKSLSLEVSEIPTVETLESNSSLIDTQTTYNVIYNTINELDINR